MIAHHASDPALDTLFLPLLEGRVSWPDDGALFLRARAGRPLQLHAWPGLVAEQSFKPEVDGLQRAGVQVVDGPERRYALVLMLPPRQRAEARALMARAIALTHPGGRVVACASNNEGARSSAADLERLAGPLETMTKHRCRVFWTRPLDGPAAPALAEEWRLLDAARPIIDGRFVSRPGVFAWDRIDPASALLASHLPADLSGRAADLGSGFGYLSVELLTRCPAVTALDLYEAEGRALALARGNLASFGARVPIEYYWRDVACGLLHSYDVIITNPPFHTQGGMDRPDIGRRFIAAAAESLLPRGRLWLVANRHLPYETLLNESFGRVRIVTQQSGYKIVEAVKAPRKSRPLRSDPLSLQGEG